MPNKATIDGAYRRSIPSEYFFTKSPSTSPRSFTESDTRLGPFIYDRVLGKGCSGTVMLATHCDTKFKVAIKIVDALELKKHPATWSKIQREIAILKLMDHPNVMKLYDCLETDTKLYMICEYVSGGELFDYIVSGEDRSAEKSLSLIAQIVTALCYCTEFHVCHRDLKPENMFMDGTTTQIKLGDFGLARMTKSRDGEVSTSCGSPHYAAPEIILGNPYTGNKSDVWSCGVILYALMCGYLPFEHENMPTLLRQIVDGQYTIPDLVPPVVADLITQMMTLDPETRIKLADIRHHPAYQNTHHFASEAKLKTCDSPFSGPLSPPVSPPLLLKTLDTSNASLDLLSRARSNSYTAAYVTTQNLVCTCQPLAATATDSEDDRLSPSLLQDMLTHPARVPRPPLRQRSSACLSRDLDTDAEFNAMLALFKSDVVQTETTDSNDDCSPSLQSRELKQQQQRQQQLAASCECLLHGSSSHSHKEFDNSVLSHMASLGFGNISTLKHKLQQAGDDNLLEHNIYNLFIERRLATRQSLTQLSPKRRNTRTPSLTKITPLTLTPFKDVSATV